MKRIVKNISYPEVCKSCEGSGKYSGKQCPACDGKGWVTINESQEETEQ